MRKVLSVLVDAAPDAIQLTLGQARHLQEIRGRQKPSLVLRTDVANIYGKELPSSRFSLMIEETMLQAVRVDAACVCVNLFQIPGAPEVHEQCVENILRWKPQADYYGMPMMIEPLVFRPNAEAGGYMVNGDLTAIMHLVRQAVELGADIIKADPTDDVSVYHKVVETAAGAKWHLHAGTTVPCVASEHPEGLACAERWIASGDEIVATSGWSTLAALVSTVPDDALPVERLKELLDRAVRALPKAPDRVRYAMNGYVIACGAYCEPAASHALGVARAIGKVKVDMGRTACKVPDAEDYIARSRRDGKAAPNRKTVRC